MTDHDALARRIAEDLLNANYLKDPMCGAHEVSAWDRVVAIIKYSIREALPTSEDAEDALRDIACYVGAGGCNSAEVDVKQMAAKIKASFDDVHRKLMESQS